MEIVNFGHFTWYQKEDGIIYFKNEDAQDWYEMRFGLTTWDEKGAFVDSVYGAWAMVDPETMKITNVEYDPSRMMPRNHIVLGIDGDHTTIHEGQIYTGTDIVDAPPLTIEEQRAAMPKLSARRLRLGLLNNGISPSSVASQIATISDQIEREKAETEWEYASEYERTHWLITQIGSQLSLTPEQIDTMWMASVNL